MLATGFEVTLLQSSLATAEGPLPWIFVRPGAVECKISKASYDDRPYGKPESHDGRGKATQQTAATIAVRQGSC